MMVEKNLTVSSPQQDQCGQEEGTDGRAHRQISPEEGRRGADQQAESTAACVRDLPESDLIAQAKRDAHAFGVLYERYVDRIFTYVYNRVRNTPDAEDLTAHTFYRALTRLHTYEDRGLPFAAWLYRIAHNLVANWYRDNSRRFLDLDDLPLPGRARSQPEEVIEEAEERVALWSAIWRLPDDRRTLLLYKFGSRLSNLEIGKLLGKSEGAVKSLYFRTLAALRQDLQAQRPDEKEDDPP